MSKKHKKMRNQDVSNRVMGKLVNVRAKTGKFVDWHKVDETVANPLDFWGLIKRVWDIAVGRKNETKA